MKFQLERTRGDGLVLIDEGYLDALDSDQLYELDILLDTSGTSELICDFPGEEWNVVWERETKSVREFCESGKMLLWLLNDTVKTKDCEIERDACITDSSKWLHVPTGKLLAVTAGELIQCLAYQFEMEKVFELTVPAGWYAFSNEGIDCIKYCEGRPSGTTFDNIQKIPK